jgi:hypothetical protein
MRRWLRSELYSNHRARTPAGKVYSASWDKIDGAVDHLSNLAHLLNDTSERSRRSIGHGPGLLADVVSHICGLSADLKGEAFARKEDP